MAILEIRWGTIHLHGDAWLQHHMLRRKVFIDRMGWDIPSAEGIEYDQYDTPASRYLLWVNEDQKVLGSVRLVPTTMPYMSLDLWPEMLGDHRPKSPDVWEATRFCCDHEISPEERARVISGLVEGCQRFGLQHGIDHYIGVMPLMIFKRSIAAAGCDYELLGPDQPIEGLRTAAARMPVRAKILRRVRVVALAREMKYRKRQEKLNPQVEIA